MTPEEVRMMRGLASPTLTLTSVLGYRDETTDRYYEPICIRFMKGRAIPATLEELGPLDPGCAGCGVYILGQAEKSWYYELKRRQEQQ